MPYRALIVCLVLLGLAVISAAQFSIPTLFDADGYLHIRIADIMRREGIIHHFHWARYSVFADRFADKDFLYHLAIIPLTFAPNLILGAKIAACIFAAAFFLGFAWCLRAYAQRALVPFFLAAPLLSAPFLQLLCRPRPMVPMLLLTLLFTHGVILRRPRRLFVISLLYTLTHVSSPLLLLFVVIAEAIRWAGERVWSWKTVCAVFLGVIAGFLLHPNFPHNLLVFYLNGILVPRFAMGWGLELGAEFFPTDTRTLALGYPLLLWSIAAVVAVGTASGNKVRTGTRVWLAIGGLFLAGAFFSRRYALHAYPMVLIGAASLVTDWWRSGDRIALLRNSARARALLTVAVCALFVRAGVSAQRQFRQLAADERAYNGRYEAIASWMNRNIPPGELIFHANWSDSQYFIGLSPQNDYFVTLDPIYMYYWDKDKYALYRSVAFGREADPYTALKEEFKVRYGYVSKDYFSGLAKQVAADARFQVLGDDAAGMFFMLK